MVESLMLQNDLPLGIQVNYIALGEEQSEDIRVDESDVLQIPRAASWGVHQR